MLRKILVRGGIGLAMIAGLGTLAVYVLARQAESPVSLGVQNGQLAPCPPTPNCVSSFSTTPSQAIDPLPYNGDTAAAKQALLDILRSYPRMTMVQDNAEYVHVLFRSPTMGFPDDSEFYFGPTNQQIHFRAAARMGRSDFNVNRSRTEQIRAELARRISAL